MNPRAGVWSAFGLAVAIGIAQLSGLLGALATTPAIDGWYAELAKPVLTPPSWTFGVVWPVLYTLMGIAVFLVWRQGIGERPVKIAIGIFAIQLVLNTLWSVIFFGSTTLTINGLNNIGIALIEIIFLWLAILATIATFARISKAAAWLLVPYLLWVSFAVYLNYTIWVLN